METKQDLKLAVVIDADNVPSANVKGMMEEIAKYGVPTFKRIYGDWTKPNLAGWKNILLENAITPIQQYGYTTGKNSTDSALIIDAMDILYTGKVDGFCIVSSDSDFTRLATRLRESGMKVFGFGEKKTPNPFIAACDKFIYLEILKKATSSDSSENKLSVSTS
ncbi:MAG TPA: NYN domain-containing protein, partial [Paludibacteraceae bacterium]|nr:NYN domain-containing protein [Paludibacteraceae bacterium]